MNKRVLVIAGGKWQIPLLKKLQSKGIEIVCSNLYEDSPGFKYADYSEISDVRDCERNLEIAKKYKVDAVLTDQSDIAVPTAAYVASELGLKTIGVELAELFTNKYKMREYLSKNGFPCPKYKICKTIEEAEFFLHELKGHAIIKPLDSQSSRGIFEIHNEKELMASFDVTKTCSKDQESVLIEQYILGTEFTVDGLVIDGTHHSLAISEKTHYEFNRNVANSLLFTKHNDTYDYNQLREINNQIINTAGLPFGLTHAEYKYENGQFYLIEMAARGGGTKISSDIVPYMSEMDTYSIWIDSLLDIPSDASNNQLKDATKERYMILRFLDHDVIGKKIKSIQGIEEIQSWNYIHDFGVNIKVGDILEKATDDSNRIAYYIATGISREDLLNIEAKIKDTLRIEFE